METSNNIALNKGMAKVSKSINCKAMRVLRSEKRPEEPPDNYLMKQNWLLLYSSRMEAELVPDVTSKDDQRPDP